MTPIPKGIGTTSGSDNASVDVSKDPIDLYCVKYTKH